MSNDTRFLFSVEMAGIPGPQTFHVEHPDTITDVIRALVLGEGHGLLFGAAELYLRKWEQIRSCGVIAVRPDVPEPVYRTMPSPVPSGRLDAPDAPALMFEFGLTDGTVRTFDNAPGTGVLAAVRSLVEGKADGTGHPLAWTDPPKDFVWSAQVVRWCRVTRKQTPAMIPDPAGKLTEEFRNQLLDRYQGVDGVEVEALDNYGQRFAQACDVAARLLWDDRYDISVGDPRLHSSPYARRVAQMFADAFGINGREEDLW